MDTPLLKLRLARDMSQEKVAQGSGLDQTYISRAERNLVHFTPESAERIAKLFGGELTPDQILRPWAYPSYQPQPRE